jgi:hypothetical protein
MANSQVSRSIGAPRPKDQNLRLPQYPSTEAVADQVRLSMGKVSRMNTVAPLSLTASTPRRLRPCHWGHALTRVAFEYDVLE